jgi:hypothetical protein
MNQKLSNISKGLYFKPLFVDELCPKFNEFWHFFFASKFYIFSKLLIAYIKSLEKILSFTTNHYATMCN